MSSYNIRFGVINLEKSFDTDSSYIKAHTSSVMVAELAMSRDFILQENISGKHPVS